MNNRTAIGVNHCSLRQMSLESFPTQRAYGLEQSQIILLLLATAFLRPQTLRNVSNGTKQQSNKYKKHRDAHSVISFYIYTHIKRSVLQHHAFSLLFSAFHTERERPCIWQLHVINSLMHVAWMPHQPSLQNMDFRKPVGPYDKSQQHRELGLCPEDYAKNANGVLE